MIVTERLVLRPARPDDLEDVHTFLSDEAGSLYWTGPAHTEIKQSRQWLNDMLANGLEQRPDFLIEHQGHVIGKAGCYRLPEIGYRIRSDHWGKGLAREAMAALLPWIAENRPEIDHLVADVDPRNEASIRLLKSLGCGEPRFQARTIETHIGWCDSLYFTITRDVMLGHSRAAPRS